MNKIIIHNNSDCSDFVATTAVSKVINSGFISGENQYCWVTSFSAVGIDVVASKTRNKTHTFKVVNQGGER